MPTDVELFGQLTRCRTGVAARDQAAQVHLVQPVTDPPDARSLVGLDTTSRPGLLSIPGAHTLHRADQLRLGPTVSNKL